MAHFLGVGGQISIRSAPLLLGLDDCIAGPSSERRWGRLVGLPYSVEVLPGGGGWGWGCEG